MQEWNAIAADESALQLQLRSPRLQSQTPNALRRGSEAPADEAVVQPVFPEHRNSRERPRYGSSSTCSGDRSRDLAPRNVECARQKQRAGPLPDALRRLLAPAAASRFH